MSYEKKCTCTESGHGHDGRTCGIPIPDDVNDATCPRCGASKPKD